MELNVCTAVVNSVAQFDNNDEAGLRALELKTLYQVGYEASLAKARETGYREGYRDGFSDGSKRGGASDRAPRSETEVGNPGMRLKGLPCVGCGYFYYSDLMECPHCKTPKRVVTQFVDSSQTIPVDGQ